MTTTAVRPDIVAFAAAVRAQLDDLPADDVDDLLDGLQADLSDQAAEAGAEFEIPDASAYAAELRTAAGLPGRAEGGFVQRVAGSVKTAATHRARSFVNTLRTQPITAWLVDTLVALRPVWWLVRAGVLYMLIIPFFPIAGGMGLGMDLLDRLVAPSVNLVFAAVLAVVVVLSVQWGRGRWAPFAWLRILRVAVSVIVAIIAPFLLVATVNEARGAMSYAQSAGYEPYEPGLSVDGQRVRNIFVYDAAGQPLTGVQLFDQEGRPLTTVGRSGLSSDWEADRYFLGGGGPVPVPESGAGFRPVWNIYPLRELPARTDPWTSEATAVLPTPPFESVPVVDPLGSATPVPTTTAFAEPAPTPSPPVLPTATPAP